MSETITIHPFANTGSRYTMVDNYLFDYIMPSIKPNSWKVLSFILRKTTGWHKTEDQLSYSQIRNGTGISSQSTVQAAIKELAERTLVIQRPGETKWEAFTYSLNRSFTATISVPDENKPGTEIVTEPGTEIVTEPGTEIVTEPGTVSVNTKERSKDSLKKQASSANADRSRPVSLLSEKEVKALKLPLSEWKQHLADEQAERGRTGVLKFLKRKVAIGPLLPDTDEARYLFDRLKTEAEARGRDGPQMFPSLACKEKFNKTTGELNGTFEQAINSGLEVGILSIPRLVNYISSPKWKENNEQTNTQERFSGRSQSDTKRDTRARNRDTRARNLEPGNGRTPEMQAKLEAAFAPKP